MNRCPSKVRSLPPTYIPGLLFTFASSQKELLEILLQKTAQVDESASKWKNAPTVKKPKSATIIEDKESSEGDASDADSGNEEP